jgi:2-polyprenyl-3-methyl-5-hydroxy-6-metoxy-1,4-benzoquinol methylase
VSGASDKIRRDFDRIARLTADDADRPGLYDGFLLQQVPRECVHVLEVGCGTGAFSRALAARGHRVTAIDVSPEMVGVARRRTSPVLDVTYECADVLDPVRGHRVYDAVVSIAMLHHVCVASALARMEAMVRPGGVLLVHDIRLDRGVWAWPVSALARVVRMWGGARAGRLRERASVRAAWAAHGRGERYATIGEVRHWARTYVPGARVFWHLQWRYTMVWRKPAAA